ncbi:HAD family hydrolase [Inhella proteolytica]|uniref:HAD family hydrolase n=1 Tax=Inhella proteolytica TaxID=2795029 RepID=A0A931J1V7_9BURK|nr:HAD family hydrolase [Inhella proteolytica]MBH9577193.1 HAD family hydrolase [Inhella proteolytica]
MKSRCIALDADGVLLDYNQAYAQAWQRAFGVRPEERDPSAYWAMDRWGVKRLEGEQLDRLRAAFDESFWSHLPAMAGAIGACQQLDTAGFELVCVSAIHPRYEAARLRNLQQLGFPIARVIATSHGDGSRSPKAAALERLMPLAFVDDYLPYLRGLPPRIHAALIHRQKRGSPNTGPELSLAHSHHEDLAAFATWWMKEGHEQYD